MGTAIPGIPSARPMDPSSSGLKFNEPQVQASEPQPEIVVIDPAAAPAAPVQPQGDDAAAGIAALKAQIAERDSLLSRQNSELESAHRLRVEAENRARAAARDTETSRASATDAEHTAILNGLTSAQAEAAALETEFAALMADGKFKEAGALQGRLGRVGARIEALEQGKAAIEAAKKNPPTPQQKTLSPDEERENFLAAQHPANAAWIRQNSSRFFTDPVFREKASAASNYANKVLGHAIGTPEYFQHVEEAVGLRTKAAPAAVTTPPPTPLAPGPTATAAEPLSGAAAPVAPAQPAQPQRQPTYAAPPSRSAPPSPSNGGTPGRYEMTPEEAKFCDDNELDKAAYCRNREQLKREGRWGTGR